MFAVDCCDESRMVYRNLNFNKGNGSIVSSVVEFEDRWKLWTKEWQKFSCLREIEVAPIRSSV